MIFFDSTKSTGAGHHSGLTRVTRRLLHELSGAALPVDWRAVAGGRVTATPADVFLSAELFSETERPGLAAFLASRACRTAAIFHDAIPLKHPRITWPQSVARHPSYMKLLAQFDRVWAVSDASRRELEEFWAWQGVSGPPVRVLALGADFNGRPRVTRREPSEASLPRLLCVGIVEPRKNQAFLLEVCEDLWREGQQFELHVVGRVNPHFGRPVLARIKRAGRTRRGAVVFHEQPNDAALAQLYGSALATVFPTIAEGCGLPLLESLWMGVPCVCSDLPVLRENADSGGCVTVPVNDRAAWRDALRGVLTNEALRARLAHEAIARPLPTWAEAAATLQAWATSQM